MNKCYVYVKLLSGDIQSIEAFDGYRISHLKNELVELEFINITDYYDLHRIMVLNGDYEPMADRDTVSMGEIYNIFIKDKPVYLTLKFNGVFNLYEGNIVNSIFSEGKACGARSDKLVSVCGYKCDRNMEEKMSDIYIDTLYVEKLYKKGYKKIRSDLYYEEVTKNMDEDNIDEYTEYTSHKGVNEDIKDVEDAEDVKDNEEIIHTDKKDDSYIYDDSDEDVLEEFIEIFIKNFCKGINKIVFCDKRL